VSNTLDGRTSEDGSGMEIIIASLLRFVKSWGGSNYTQEHTRRVFEMGGGKKGGEILT